MDHGSNPRAFGLYELTFSEDGSQFLISGGHLFDTGYSALLWKLDVFALACRAANRNITREEWTQYLGDAPYVGTCPKPVDSTSTWANLIPVAND